MRRLVPKLPKSAIRVIKWVLAVLVLAAVAWYLQKTWNRLIDEQVPLRLEPGWFVLALVFHLLGMVCFAANFWRLVNQGDGPRVGVLASTRAHMIGHLGKYVPGKAMVAVMRVGLVHPYGARISTATWATMYETLVMMAAGGLVATLGVLISRSPSQLLALEPTSQLLIGLGLGLGLMLSLLAWPSVFGRLSRVLSLPFPQVTAESLPHYRPALWVQGLLIASVGWISWGLSQWAVLCGLGVPSPSVTEWPLIVASVSLATVVGFVVAVLPGGLGIRESVLWTILALVVDPSYAVVGALVLRLTWVLSELATSGLLYVIRPGPTTTTAIPRPLETSPAQRVDASTMPAESADPNGLATPHLGRSIAGPPSTTPLNPRAGS